jgi:cell wall-associated NlpC family hydrolase
MTSRRALLLLSALLSTLLVATPASASADFSDVGGGVHAASITALANEGIVNGCNDGSFCPDRGLTRGQVASVLYRALDVDAPGGGTTFSDTAGSVHREAIEAMAAAGVTNGCESGKFCPNDYISRGQLASLLARGLGLPAAASGTYFTDISGTHQPAIETLADQGIAAGCTLVAFCPAQRLTRAQGATFIARALGHVATVDLAPFADRQKQHDAERAQASAASAAPGARAVEVATAQVGKPYQWGGNGPASFDCSGLTRFAWSAAGVNLPRTSRDQYSGTQRISRSDLQPGDLIFSHSPVSHVAMYIGGGKVVEAPYSGNTVRISSTGLSRSGIVGYGRPR